MYNRPYNFYSPVIPGKEDNLNVTLRDVQDATYGLSAMETPVGNLVSKRVMSYDCPVPHLSTKRFLAVWGCKGKKPGEQQYYCKTLNFLKRSREVWQSLYRTMQKMLYLY